MRLIHRRTQIKSISPLFSQCFSSSVNIISQDNDEYNNDSDNVCVYVCVVMLRHPDTLSQFDSGLVTSSHHPLPLFLRRVPVSSVKLPVCDAAELNLVSLDQVTQVTSAGVYLLILDLCVQSKFSRRSSPAPFPDYRNQVSDLYDVYKISFLEETSCRLVTCVQCGQCVQPSLNLKNSLFCFRVAPHWLATSLQHNTQEKMGCVLSPS